MEKETTKLLRWYEKSVVSDTLHIPKTFMALEYVIRGKEIFPRPPKLIIYGSTKEKNQENITTISKA